VFVLVCVGSLHVQTCVVLNANCDVQPGTHTTARAIADVCIYACVWSLASMFTLSYKLQPVDYHRHYIVCVLVLLVLLVLVFVYVVVVGVVDVCSPLRFIM
jgi:predicted ferric reductase